MHIAQVFMPGHVHGFLSDFYSLGITTFQLLVGGRPYPPDDVAIRTIVRFANFVPPDTSADIAVRIAEWDPCMCVLNVSSIDWFSF
jgi:serine/threonine protein kinase